MSPRSRMVLVIAGSLAGILLLLAAAGVLLLRSQWFHEQVRRRIVAEVERSTGGRSEIRSFHFDWKTLRAEVRDFVVHGTEPPGKPPLLRAESVAVGIRIVSLLKRQFDIDSLAVQRPRIYLIVGPDGRTNVPEPKVRSRKLLTDTILDLAIGRFQVNDGTFEVENRYRYPFDASGRNLTARFAYNFPKATYSGNIAVRPLALRWGTRPPLPVDVSAEIMVARNRIQVAAAQLNTAASSLHLEGAVTGLNATPTGAFHYAGTLDLRELGGILALRSQQSGQAQVAGNFDFTGSQYRVTGGVNAAGVAFRQGKVRLHNLRAQAQFEITPGEAVASNIRAAGSTSVNSRQAPFTAHVARAALRNKDLDLSGLRLAALGGMFSGSAILRDFDRYRIAGEVSGFELRDLARLSGSQAPPANGRVSGPVRAEGSLRHANALKATAHLNISPAPGEPPVQGSVNANYNAATGTLDLGSSFLQLPSTRLEAAGVLGRELNVRLNSTNLDDLLPLLGARSLPIRLENGTAAFTGTITGKLDDPLVLGKVWVKSFSVEGRHFDTLSAAVRATKAGVALQGAQVARGTLRAQFNASLGLRDWKPAGESPLAVTGSFQNAAAADLATLAGRADMPVTGTISGSGQISGTFGNPRIDAAVVAVNGAINGEPYDRIAAKLAYSGETLEIASAEFRAGPKTVTFSGLYRHARGDLRNGTLRFEARSNSFPLEQVATVAKSRPGLAAIVQLTASGTVDVSKGRPQLADLNATASAQRIALNGQALGDARLAASSKGGVLTVHVQSDLAGADIRGDGQFRLVDDYPGTARVTFARVSLERMEQLVAGARLSGLRRIAGMFDGQADLRGPVLDPKQWQAEVRIAQLRFGPSRDLQLPGQHQDYFLRAASPIVLTVANGVVRVDSARLIGRATDLRIAGSVAFYPKGAFDLKVNGRVDLASLQDFDRDISASGFLLTDASVRGPLDRPQVVGQLEFNGATLNYTDVPNGIYNARGLIRFTGAQATIQYLEGESGGGKVTIKGFLGYGGQEIVYRIHATAKEVRVRYPQGLSTVANANLNLTGGTAHGMLAGTVTIVRTGFNPHSDFSSLLFRSAEPVRTPTARTGFLSNLHFDVQIESAPDITFQSSLAQNIQIEANLRLRGTVTNPSLLGRINLSQGEVIFFGTRYTINQGSISFFNPVRIEPILNVDLETKARGVDITLTVSGPMNKLNLTPRSDPPLQFSEIVALLATGRAPTSDPTLVTQQTTFPQTWQQMGASALLGQAIANPVAGRLQRFFGVTKLKIDPSLTGVENNPQARLTLEQQITPNITFTYITNVTNSNPLVVQVEWAISPKWSVIAIRDENGWFGLDFLFKKRF